MVSKKIDKAMIKRICNRMKYYDKHRMFPEDKIRIDITISSEALDKLQGQNKSQFINNLILVS